MMELIQELPGNVVGVIGHGMISASDYETVLIPALKTALANNRKVNIVYVLGSDFEGYTPGAMWDDTKVGMLHLGSWGRVAVVCDKSWIRDLSRVFGFVMPFKVKTYHQSELDLAKEWVSEQQG